MKLGAAYLFHRYTHVYIERKKERERKREKERERRKERK